MVQLTIVHPNQSNETIPGTVGYERTREIGKMRRARIEVLREAAQNVTLQPKTDKIELGNKDTLRLVDIENGAETYTLVCYSLEWDANRVAPTPGGDLQTGDDQTLINNFVGAVPNWSAGTINSFTGTLEFIFNHAQQHEAIRRIERNVQGEILFRDSGTVDYTDRLGSDKSGSIELSSSAGTIEDEIQITKRGRELDGTHVRVLGAHEGEAQLSANLVPAADGASYDNRVNYTSPRWSSGDPRDWDRWVNKDITDQNTLDEEAATLAEELKSELVEAKATVPDGVGISIGDTVRVVKPEADLDRDMRIHRLKEVVEGAVRKLDVLLSTRTTLRKDGSDDLRDIQRFNTGFQGSSVNLQAGPVLQPVSSSINATIPFRYPDVDFENSVEVRVAGRPYRSYVGAAGHDHDVTISDFSSSNINTDFQQVDSGDINSGGADVDGVTLDNDNNTSTPQTEVLTNFSLNSSTGTTGINHFVFNVYCQDLNGILGTQALSYEIENLTKGETYTQLGEFNEVGMDNTIIIPVFKDIHGDDLEVRLVAQFSTEITFDATFYFVSSGGHTHNVSISDTATSTSTVGFDPGVNLWDGNDQSPTLEPSNVNVIVNNNTVASNVGSGTFETVVDISGDLNKGAWNTVELSSDSKGFVNATVAARAYQQIGTR
ncbi:hypothetical protein OSG_eHP3_00010 [environmental Halophage eHP-3]|nr:hypothetical protein OSG_eHP3_00010 [environmental Halophage eHP-3]